MDSTLRSSLALLAVAALCACTGGTKTPDASASAAPQTSAAAVVSASAATPGSAAPIVSAEPTAAASAAVSAAPAASSAAASAPPAELPPVEVKNIGMHIGGGPNDDVTKGPIKRSVAPHMDAFRACYAKASDPKKGGDVSIDLRIEKNGGKAQIKKYKSMIEGAGFEDCVKAVFDGIDFEKPKTGATVVSYSLRFTPKKG